jgi:hypothetical protein
MQKNEGKWDFSMDEGPCSFPLLSAGPQVPSKLHARGAIVLEVDVGRYLDTSLIKADVQPSYVRYVGHTGSFHCL